MLDLAVELMNAGTLTKNTIDVSHSSTEDAKETKTITHQRQLANIHAKNQELEKVRDSFVSKFLWFFCA